MLIFDRWFSHIPHFWNIQLEYIPKFPWKNTDLALKHFETDRLDKIQSISKFCNAKFVAFFMKISEFIPTEYVKVSICEGYISKYCLFCTGYSKVIILLLGH